MKLNFKIILFALLILTSCFEVSEKNLFEDFEQQIVIEGLLNNIDSQCIVRIQRSVHPFDSIVVNPVNNAQVLLSGNSGESELLSLIAPGIYESSNLKGIPLSKYSLRVNVDNENYVAYETMDNPGLVHRVELVYLDEHVEEEGYFIRLYIEKELNRIKHYKLNVFKNDSLFNEYSDLLVFNDAYNQDVLEYLVPYAFEEGDSVVVNLHAISENMSRYYYELGKQASNTFSNIQPPMTNPPSNFTNNALGYFQVSAKTTLNVVVQ